MAKACGTNRRFLLGASGDVPFDLSVPLTKRGRPS